MKNLFAQIPQFFLALAISIMAILIHLSYCVMLMNYIQTVKSFNYFYSLLALAVATSVALLYVNENTKYRFTVIDWLLLAFVAWVNVNKNVLHKGKAQSIAEKKSNAEKLLGRCTLQGTPISTIRSFMKPDNRQKGRDNHAISLKVNGYPARSPFYSPCTT